MPIKLFYAYHGNDESLVIPHQNKKMGRGLVENLGIFTGVFYTCTCYSNVLRPKKLRNVILMVNVRPLLAAVYLSA